MRSDITELERFAALAHFGMAVLHARAAITGRFADVERGAALALHGLALAYNWRRPDNRSDVAKHVAALAALILCPDDRTLNTLAAVYDFHASMGHARRLR